MNEDKKATVIADDLPENEQLVISLINRGAKGAIEESSLSKNEKEAIKKIAKKRGSATSAFKMIEREDVVYSLTENGNKAREAVFEANITGEELKEGLTLVLSFIMPDPVFSGQTKDVLSSSEARTIVQRLVSKDLKTWLEGNPKDAKAIVDKALLARAAREKAKKAKETVLLIIRMIHIVKITNSKVQFKIKIQAL